MSEQPSSPSPGVSRSGPRPPRDRGGEGGGGGRPKRRFRRGRRKVCRFCADKSMPMDYKWASVLEDFISERGRIVPARTTGTCAKHQRRLKLGIKRARQAALLPFSRS